MTSHTELPCFLVLAVALGGVAGCSAGGRAPPEPIGYAGPARASRQELVLEGRVDEAPAAQYAAEPLPEADASFSYMDTPNLAGHRRQTVQSAYGAQQQSAPLDAIDVASAEPVYQSSEGMSTDLGTGIGADSATAVPSEGINIDAELGVGAEPGVGAAETTLMTPPPAGSHFTIAEDNPSQTVVDGIGTDDPVVLLPASRTATR